MEDDVDELGEKFHGVVPEGERRDFTGSYNRRFYRKL
jgi:hypothetical protein